MTRHTFIYFPGPQVPAKKTTRSSVTHPNNQSVDSCPAARSGIFSPFPRKPGSIARIRGMSELTFNIADYRPLGRASARERSSDVQEHNGFVVLSSNATPRECQNKWLEARPEVVDIRSVRESQRSIPRRGKILRFSSASSHRVYMMPVHDDFPKLMDDDPGPLVA